MCGSNSRAIVSVYVTSYKIRECSSKDKFRKYKSTHRPPTKTRRRKAQLSHHPVAAAAADAFPALLAAQHSLLRRRGSKSTLFITLPEWSIIVRSGDWEGAFVCVAAISLWWLCVEVSRTTKRTPLKQQQPAAMFECNVIQFWTIVVGRVSIREFLSHSDPPPKFAHFNL